MMIDDDTHDGAGAVRRARVTLEAGAVDVRAGTVSCVCRVRVTLEAGVANVTTGAVPGAEIALGEGTEGTPTGPQDPVPAAHPGEW